jgi:hypothetical protein
MKRVLIISAVLDFLIKISKILLSCCKFKKKPKVVEIKLKNKSNKNKKLNKNGRKKLK